jgi:hypothetical protein
MGRAYSTRKPYRVLVGKTKVNTPLGRPRSGGDNIRMDLREIGWDDIEWIHLFQNKD